MPTNAPTARDSTPAAPAEPVAPLKPRKGLFIGACAVFAVWVAFLLVLYFTTVRGRIDPHHHHDTSESVSNHREMTAHAGV